MNINEMMFPEATNGDIVIHESVKYLMESGSWVEIVPDSSWLKADIQTYMDDNGIAYNSIDTKQELLDKINAPN